MSAWVVGWGYNSAECRMEHMPVGMVQDTVVEIEKDLEYKKYETIHQAVFF
jgi:hypothetical protein